MSDDPTNNRKFGYGEGNTMELLHCECLSFVTMLSYL